jgi:flagellar hook-length control protein FliK
MLRNEKITKESVRYMDNRSMGDPNSHQNNVELSKLEILPNQLRDSFSGIQSGEAGVQQDIPSHVIHQVQRQIQYAITNGKDSVTFQLHPPELGSLRINLRMKDNILRVHIRADSQRAGDVILSHVQLLKDTLMDHGIRLESLNVKIDYAFSNLSENQSKWQDRHETTFHTAHWTSFKKDMPDGMDDLMNNYIYGTNGLLDILI